MNIQPRPHQLVKQFDLPNGTVQAFCGLCGQQVILESWPPTVAIPCVAALQIDAMKAAAMRPPVRPWFWRVRLFVALFHKWRAARKRWIEAGRPRPDATELAARKAACDSCPWRRGAIVSQCGACGCFLRSKQKMKTEQCPQRKWGEEPCVNCNCNGG